MTTSYSTNIIIGYLENDLIKAGLCKDGLNYLIEYHELDFIDPCDSGVHNSGVIGF